ncbi:MAG: glycoside hydrolase, partial [Aquificota bacterium]
MIHKQFLEQAKKVLDTNWTGRYTVPSIHLYPHQWNWDSGFIAIGYARY